MARRFANSSQPLVALAKKVLYPGVGAPLRSRAATASAPGVVPSSSAFRLHRARTPAIAGGRSRCFSPTSSAALAGAHVATRSEVLFQPDSDFVVEWSSEPIHVDYREGISVVFVDGVAEGSKESISVDLPMFATPVRAAVERALSVASHAEGFDGKVGTSKTVLVDSGSGTQGLVVFVGTGPRSQDVDWRLAGATAAGALKTLKASVARKVVFSSVSGLVHQCVRHLLEGFSVGLHVDRRFQGKMAAQKRGVETPWRPDEVRFVSEDPQSDKYAREATALASGTIFARELVSAPANFVTPPALAAAAEDLASRTGLSATILDEAACEEMGMGAFLAVGRCSDLPSHLIHLKYTPPGEITRRVGIVGKGLTFDSGGYNLKAGEAAMIELMKFDMGGAAATLGAAAAIAQLRPEGVEAHFVIATCENMVSGNIGALRPGDIIRAMDGTTIEVNNTDAEGRLTLADALLYCQRQGATEVVDIATLTGACMIALGGDIAGMWSNSDEFSLLLQTAAKQAGEKVWRMPLEEAYFEGLKSDFADMKNTGPRFGGAITAALFLSRFIHKDVKWAHLDIAGTVWADKPKGLVTSAGGTGTMVRTLTHFVVPDL